VPGSGTIVKFTSTAKSVSLALIGYYFASKAAFRQAAAQTLRHELASRGIRVLEVVPGATDTALRDIDAIVAAIRRSRTRAV
jgi:uncharacterized protein